MRTIAKANRSERQGKDSRRNVLIAAALLGGLTATSMLLVVLAPAPLIPDPARSLFAGESSNIPETIDMALDSRVPIEAGRWQYIYIHHSKGRAGDALSIGRHTGGMGDHFLIGNGDGCADGEVQVGQRWNEQHSARLPGITVQGSCITICLIGDFDQLAPTTKQVKRLGQLVVALQRRCGIPAENIIAYDRPGSVAGIGRHFPLTALGQSVQR